MISEPSLINEIDLGTQLNQCVHQKRRADFSLMLAMLTEDAREFSEFALPKVDLISEKSVKSDSQLRKEFDLPEAQALGLSKLEDIEQYNQAELVAHNQLASLHFDNAINPKALAFRNNKNYIPSSIVSNTSLHIQNRYQNRESASPKALAFNAKEWLKAVQNTVVTASV